jgi:hypothetical protein
MYGHQSVNLTKALHDSLQLQGTVKESYPHESFSDRQNSQTNHRFWIKYPLFHPNSFSSRQK